MLGKSFRDPTLLIVRLTAPRGFSWSRGTHLAPLRLRPLYSKLKMFAPIVIGRLAGHPFCARYDIHVATSRHVIHLARAR